MSGKPKRIKDLSIEELYELLEKIREESPETKGIIESYLNARVCETEDILMRTTSDNSWAKYQASTIYNKGLHYTVLHNLVVGRTRTIMGNTLENLITADGYKDRPKIWTYRMLEQACRHHGGLVPGNLKVIGSGKDMRKFLDSLTS